MSKGVEISRRDGCDALVKIFKESVAILFRTNNISAMKQYLEHNWVKIQQEFVNLIDFVYAKEVRLGSYKQMPASAYAAERRMELDPMLRPKRGERVKYVVVSNPDSDKLRDRVMPIEEFVDK